MHRGKSEGLGRSDAACALALRQVGRIGPTPTQRAPSPSWPCVQRQGPSSTPRGAGRPRRSPRSAVVGWSRLPGRVLFRQPARGRSGPRRHRPVRMAKRRVHQGRPRRPGVPPLGRNGRPACVAMRRVHQGRPRRPATERKRPPRTSPCVEFIVDGGRAERRPNDQRKATKAKRPTKGDTQAGAHALSLGRPSRTPPPHPTTLRRGPRRGAARTGADGGHFRTGPGGVDGLFGTKDRPR
jgi:hypothetical protein